MLFVLTLLVSPLWHASVGFCDASCRCPVPTPARVRTAPDMRCVERPLACVGAVQGRQQQPPTSRSAGQVQARATRQSGARPCALPANRGLSDLWQVSGFVLSVSIPYIKQDIPMGIVFRALGFVADKDILERILYGFEDQQVHPAAVRHLPPSWLP